MNKSDALVQQALQAAAQARQNSYSPYSKYAVGAAVITKNGAVFAGCNVENASYGATICAERNAVIHAVADSGKPEITAVVIVTDANPLAAPCGMCLQVLQEFCAPESKVFLANPTQIIEEHKFSHFLPNPFQLS